mmetsp:Transcript_5026/g.14647  ORF Transcript_5026/g.14647 Transcript_5026/m.14647 type:complete len:251 (-) Transcript_5026:275-1027(-)|eukprot:CAMPEP_0119550574 /NCGR_PEP_ID=MMETSP1352-20130426/4068_1 /TAXON_ID=265584 /ORGANISM="Stauroneis constricta, Strain CCMP1120" /LENGTH=250 /DNA_ID=CAMNT_0007596469 /DNA_START=207 /DNA_END=959 /DNA_ORIENTATION=+
MDTKNYARHDEDAQPLMVTVTAPASLPAGYTFDALINDDPDRTFTVEVPDGGVAEGEKFLAPVPALATNSRIIAPTGKWKDGLFSCFSLGVCHPHLCCALWCTKCAMAQVMTRMELTWLGEPGPQVATKSTFRVVVSLIAAYAVYSMSLALVALDYEPADVPLYIIILRTMGDVLFAIWGVYSLYRTRQSVRAQYSIPEENCIGCEDLCCSIFCTCCVTAQMSRHTGEFETYPGVCCTATGHPPGTPLTV